MATSCEGSHGLFINSFIFISRSKRFALSGVGQNFKPLSKIDFSEIDNLCFDKLIILGTILFKLFSGVLLLNKVELGMRSFSRFTFSVLSSDHTLSLKNSDCCYFYGFLYCNTLYHTLNYNNLNCNGYNCCCNNNHYLNFLF